MCGWQTPVFFVAMNKRKQLFFLLPSLLLVLTSCFDGKSGKDDAAAAADSDSVQSAQPTELELFEKRKIPTSVDANFEDFFYTFSNDDDFADLRTDSVITLVEDGEQRSLPKTEWNERHLFKYQELYAFIYTDEDDLELLKSASIDSVATSWVKLDSTLADRYEFDRIDGKWVFTRIVRKKQLSQSYVNFLKFYQQFIEDPDFQLASLANPVKVIYGGDSEMDEGGTDNLKPEDWSEFHAQTPMPEKTIVLMDYGQKIGNGPVVTMMVRSITEAVYAKYRFRRTGSQWKLQSIEFL